MQKVRESAKKAKISDYIEQTTKGYNSFMGERGIQLSGGQLQRIGIARALYKDCQILVLDEATSSLDNRTERDIIETINTIDKNITLITIAHRLSTIKNCTRIINLDEQIKSL